MPHSRRSFLSALGAYSAAGLLPTDRWPPGRSDTSAAAAGGHVRGLAAAPNDFLFAPGLIYLQTGSLGPTPRPVMERTIAAWHELERDPTFHGYGKAEVDMEEVREKAANFVGCTRDELILTNSTTDGMNWVAQGLTLAAGDRVLSTDQEHPGGRACWDYLVRRQGVALDIVTIPPGEHDARAIVDRFSTQITARTRVLSFSHLLSSTGLRMPVAELSALARARGCIAVVDGAQAVGGIDVDVKSLGCHVYATSGHKWLLGPKGTGLLYLSHELGPVIDPIALQSGRAAYSASSGVCNIPGVLGLGAAIDYVSAVGTARIETYNLGLRNRLYASLKGVPRLRVVSAPPGPLASPLLTYELPPDITSSNLRQRLRDKYQIEVKIVPNNWLNGHRISTHLFNSEKEVDSLVAALTRELA